MISNNEQSIHSPAKGFPLICIFAYISMERSYSVFIVLYVYVYRFLCAEWRVGE